MPLKVMVRQTRIQLGWHAAEQGSDAPTLGMQHGADPEANAHVMNGNARTSHEDSKV